MVIEYIPLSSYAIILVYVILHTVILTLYARVYPRHLARTLKKKNVLALEQLYYPVGKSYPVLELDKYCRNTVGVGLGLPGWDKSEECYKLGILAIFH